jgi:hypothetical protein
VSEGMEKFYNNYRDYLQEKKDEWSRPLYLPRELG